MSEATILILVIFQIIFIGTIFHLVSKNNSLKNIIKNNNKEKVKIEEKLSIRVGTRGLMRNYPLAYTKDDIKFKVDYEVEIVSVTENMAKVNSISYTSLDKVANDPANKPGIISFLKDKWVSISDIEIIYDENFQRDIKLSKLLD